MSLLLLLNGGNAVVPVFVNVNQPNIADFETFLSTTVQIPTTALPATSPWITYAFNQALATVYNPPWAAQPGILYCLAVYNLATAILFQITPDQSGQTYFANARGNSSSATPPGFGLNSPITGLVNAASDNGSSTSLTAPTWATGMTIADLGLYQTPYGRAYLAWSQSFGPTVWGLT